MTRDDIIRIMREVCFEEADDVLNEGIWAITDEELERFVARVEAAKEQEMLAEGWVLDFPPPKEEANE